MEVKSRSRQEKKQHRSSEFCRICDKQLFFLISKYSQPDYVVVYFMNKEAAKSATVTSLRRQSEY